MLRRLAAVSSAALLILSACSGSDGDANGDTGDATTTTTGPSTTLPSGSTTTMAPLEPADGTPAAELRSFTTSSVFRVEVPPSIVNVESTGTNVDGSFTCTTDLDMDGNQVTTQVVSVPEGVFVDAGNGFTEVPAPSAANSTAGCPADPAFWSGFVLMEIPEELPREQLEINGIPAYRVDLVEYSEVASQLGLVPDVEGASYEQLTMAFAEDGDWLVSMNVVANLTPEAAALAFGVPETEGEGEGATISMTLDIADPDDPDLSVEKP